MDWMECGGSGVPKENKGRHYRRGDAGQPKECPMKFTISAVTSTLSLKKKKQGEGGF
jgi:hypothetical protein